jgi:hypothetical protein
MSHQTSTHRSETFPKKTHLTQPQRPTAKGNDAGGQEVAPPKVAGLTPIEVTAVEVKPAEEAATPEPALSPAETVALALSPSQQTAIEKMLSGHTLAASATAAGVTRMTLYRWLHHDPKFQAAYSAWQLDAITGAQTKLLAMTDTAVNTVGRAVKSDARIAVTLLKAVGALDRPRPGSTDPEEVQRLMEIARIQHENRLDEEFFEAKHLHGTGRRSRGDIGLGAIGLGGLMGGGRGSAKGGGKGGGKGMSVAETESFIAVVEKELGG